VGILGVSKALFVYSNIRVFLGYFRGFKKGLKMAYMEKGHFGCKKHT